MNTSTGESNNLSISSRLEEERLRMGLSQSEFGRLGGVGRTTQVNYESGATSPSALYLNLLAQHGVDVMYVVLGQRNAAVAPTHSIAPLSKEEEALVDKYRRTDARGKAAARAVLLAVTQPPPRKAVGE